MIAERTHLICFQLSFAMGQRNAKDAVADVGLKERCGLGSSDDAVAADLDAFRRLQDEMAILK